MRYGVHRRRRFTSVGEVGRVVRGVLLGRPTAAGPLSGSVRSLGIVRKRSNPPTLLQFRYKRATASISPAGYNGRGSTSMGVISCRRREASLIPTTYLVRIKLPGTWYVAMLQRLFDTRKEGTPAGHSLSGKPLSTTRRMSMVSPLRGCHRYPTARDSSTTSTKEVTMNKRPFRPPFDGGGVRH